MSLTLITTYNNAANFAFNSSDIEMDSLGARLALQYFPQQDFSEDFADDTGFVYDNAKAEFVGGVIRQSDQTPADMQLVAKYASVVDATWSKIGGGTAVLNGAPTIVAGQLVCNGAQGVRYQTTANLFTQGAIKFKYIPAYSGPPAQNENVVSIEQRTGAGGNRLLLTHSPSGDNFRITLTSGASNNIYTAVTIGASNLNLQSGTAYELELNWDSVTGTIRLFIDGVVDGTLSPGAWSFNSEAMDLVAGASTNIYNSALASFDDVALFNVVQHTGNYTPGYTLLDFIYAESTATLPVFTYSGPGLLRPASPPTSTETGTPRYIIQNKYWDGAAWSDSDGTYAQATSKADIVAHIADFPSTGLSTITVKLAFGNSNTQSNVDQINFSVIGQAYAVTNPTITPNDFTRADGLFSFASSPPPAGSDAVRFVLERRSALGGQSSYFYWDGAAWVTSNNSYAQSSSAADINTNAASIDLSAGYYIRFVAFLHSEDSFTTPELVSTTMVYDFSVVPSTPNKVLVYGWLVDPAGNPLVGAVYIDNITPFVHSGLIFPVSRVTKATDTNGYFEFDGNEKIVETATISKTYRVTIVYTDDLIENLVETITVPDQESVNLATLLFAT